MNKQIHINNLDEESEDLENEFKKLKDTVDPKNLNRHYFMEEDADLANVLKDMGEGTNELQK